MRTGTRRDASGPGLKSRSVTRNVKADVLPGGMDTPIFDILWPSRAFNMGT